jgi:chromosomal replication initiator protein
LKDKILTAIQNNFEDVDDIIILEPSEKEDYLLEKEKIIEKPVLEPTFNEIYKLNEKYTFENFVVGNSNKFVFAAAQSVAENPGKKYNPLFIYGGVGLGKTHLLHAIGNYARKNNPDIKVLYTTCEKFANDYIQSLKANKTEDANKAFRDKYRQVDILMIDDIQFLAKKKSTQEEFFHTFNDLYNFDKQIIISSDRHPRNIEELEERLSSRFQGGLIHDIQKPDFETKLAILEKKAEREHVEVDSEVLEYLAEKINSNIRELEGSFNKVMSLASLMGKKKATIEEAQEALRDIEIEQELSITTSKIIDYVCRYYKIKKEDLIGKKRNKEIVEPRQICVYIMTKLLDIPLTSIGEAMGGKDYTTMISSRDKISKLIETDKSLEADINHVIEMIKNES